MIDENTVRAVIGRVDRLDGDVTKLQQSVGVIESVVKRALAQEEERSHQPDWLTVNKPAVAEAMLLGTALWMERYGALLGLDVAQCWPWHPVVVSLLLAASQHHKAAYKGSSPVAVTDFLTRHIPAIKRAATVPCLVASSHKEAGVSYTFHLDQLPDLATWWANDRTGLAPGLTPQVTVADVRRVS